MKQLYALPLLALALLAATAQAQAPPCLTNTTTPAGQSAVAAASWGGATLPTSTSVVMNLTTTAGSNLATITSCNATLITNLAGISGPNVPAGTSISGGACGTNTVQLSQNATVTGAAPHTFTLPAYTSNFPPTNQGVPTGLNCSVCPALFTVPMCAGQRFNYYMCVGNIYTFSMCSSAANWDSYISITNTAGTALATGSPTSDDDGCGTANGHATLSFVPTATGTYMVRVWNGNCLTTPAGTCGTMQVACNPVPPPPSNDEPQNAISLGATASTVCTFVNGTTTWATQSATTPTGCLTGGCGSATGAYAGADVWYSVGIPASGNLSVIMQENSITNGSFAVYTGVPGTLTQVAGSCRCDGFVSLSGLPAGTAYIRVWPEQGQVNSGTFQICAYEPIPPPNDNPCGASSGTYALTVNATCSNTTFSTESATDIAALYTVPAPGCATVNNNDVWFSAVMPGTGSMTINTQAGTLTDMAMAVYTVSAGTVTDCASQGPASLQLVQCNAVNNGDPMPSLTISGTSGVRYYIRMWNQGTGFGTANICAVVNTPPANDNPCGAIPLTVTNGCVFPAPFSTQFATLGPTIPPWPAGVSGITNIGGCTGPFNSDVWFTAVVPASGQLQLNTDDLGMTSAGMAVYTAGGTSCPNLTLNQVASTCYINGSTYSSQMPGGTISLPAGTVVYIRVWRRNNNDGTFLLCARNPVNPPGCYYTLNLADAAGDGWNGGYVRLCVGGSCTNYTVYGNGGNLVFPASLGQTITLEYFPVGGFQNQVSFGIQANNGFNIFNSANPPVAGFNTAFIVNADCNVPPAPISDCIGSQQVCNTQSFSYAPGNFGNSQDLGPTNRGCLSSNERQGAWYRFTTNAAGTIAFTIGIGMGTDYDFAVWGPFSGAPTCPPPGPPLRCNWSGTTGPTGLNYTALGTSEGAGGPPFSRWIDALANQTYLLYIDNYTMNGLTFSLSWNTNPANLLDCVLLPVEWLALEAEPKGTEVNLTWATASEHNSDFFRIQRSADGERYATVGVVEAAGSSSVRTDYLFTDKAPHAGLNYYRVEQVDADGRTYASNVVTALFRPGAGLSVYPNPAGESLWASFDLVDEGLVAWRILDASGREVGAGRADAAAGVNQVEIPLGIESGTYALLLTDSRGNPLGTARFIKR